MEVMMQQHMALLRIPNKQLKEVQYKHIVLAKEEKKHDDLSFENKILLRTLESIRSGSGRRIIGVSKIINKRQQRFNIKSIRYVVLFSQKE